MLITALRALLIALLLIAGVAFAYLMMVAALLFTMGRLIITAVRNRDPKEIFDIALTIRPRWSTIDADEEESF